VAAGAVRTAGTSACLGAPHPGLGLDDENEDFVRRVDPATHLEYYTAVAHETKGWLRTAPLELLDEVPDVEGLLLPGRRRHRPRGCGGMVREAGSFFLSWSVIGHGLMHIGEMFTVKGQLGIGETPS
jgi:hypothetical protein